jgi:hypothetical protein
MAEQCLGHLRAAAVTRANKKHIIRSGHNH